MALMHREESTSEDADSVTGKVFLKHTRNNEYGKLSEFSKTGDFKGRRYDEDGWGGTFGKDGVYLAEEGNKWNTDEDLKWQYAGDDTTTYDVEVDFSKGLLITPENIKSIVEKVQLTHKVSREWRTGSEQYDRKAQKHRSREYLKTPESQIEVVGSDIAAWAKDNGYDGIIVRGFNSHLENIATQADISEEAYQRTKKELESRGMYNKGQYDREQLVDQEEFREDFFEDAGVDDAVGQDQVFFYPERISSSHRC